MEVKMGMAELKMEDLPHYTYDDYVQWEGRWEIIRGIPYAMAPTPSFKHQRISVKIVVQLEMALEDCPYCTVVMPVDYQIAEDTVVQPDVLVICSENIDIKSMDAKKIVEPPLLVFEILSPSTARKDRVVKYRLYEHAGVKYFCIVDPETRSAEVFDLNRDKYRKREQDEFKDGKMIFELGKCKVEFDFGEIFNR
jgi:Uma2 family endonuclease